MENLPENDHSFAMIQAQQSTGAVFGAAVTPGDFHFLTTHTQSMQPPFFPSQWTRWDVTELQLFSRSHLTNKLPFRRPANLQPAVEPWQRAVCTSQHTTTCSGERVKGTFCQMDIFKHLLIKPSKKLKRTCSFSFLSALLIGHKEATRRSLAPSHSLPDNRSPGSCELHSVNKNKQKIDFSTVSQNTDQHYHEGSPQKPLLQHGLARLKTNVRLPQENSM